MTADKKTSGSGFCKRESERKFLIEYPDIVVLSSQNGVKIKKITQTYLESGEHASERVRKITDADGTESFVYTKKTRVSDITSLEEECEISRGQYEEYLKRADKNRRAVEKVRYAFPCGSHVAEIDIYGFWRDRAILETELEAEDEEFEIPPFVCVIKEVTHDMRYKNACLARSVVFEKI